MPWAFNFCVNFNPFLYNNLQTFSQFQKVYYYYDLSFVIVLKNVETDLLGCELMGTPIDPPPDPGTQCDDCWAEGQPFHGQRMPKYILATFDNVQVQAKNCEEHNKKPIPPIPDHIELLLKQNDENPCLWTLNYDMLTLGWTSFLRYWNTEVYKSLLWMGRYRIGLDCSEEMVDIYDYLFYCYLEEPCQVFFGSNVYKPPYYDGTGGAGYVTWLP